MTAEETIAECIGGPLDGDRVVVDYHNEYAFPWPHGWYYADGNGTAFYWRVDPFIPEYDERRAARVRFA